MRALSALVVLSACLILAHPAAAEDPTHRKLAERYAPVVFQESRSAVLDFITGFDFDGDWRGDNNWRNAYLFDLPGYVYHSVIESSRHYFITYAFYHPRDYTATPYEGFAPKTEHENDMEGCTVTIEKDGTPYGRPILLQTLAHDVFFKYNNREARRVTAGALKLDGAMTFVDGRPAVHIEPEGHGVKAATAAAVRDPAAFLWAHRFDVGTTFCCADSYLVPGGRPLEGLTARVAWVYDAGAEFSNDLSVTAPLRETPLSGAAVVRLSESPRWDRNQTVQRVRVTIESAAGTVATATPGNLPDSDQLAITQIVFDRDAFSNTFEQP